MLFERLNASGDEQLIGELGPTVRDISSRPREIERGSLRLTRALAPIDAQTVKTTLDRAKRSTPRATKYRELFLKPDAKVR